MNALPRTFDRFTLTEEIGRYRNLYTRYRATDTQARREVELRILDAKLNEAGLRTNLRKVGHELIRLRHPNLVPVLDIDVTESGGFIVTPAVSGERLSDYLAHVSLPLPADEAISIVVQVAAALDYIERHGMIHGDISPDTVIITRDNRVMVDAVGMSRLTTSTGFAEPYQVSVYNSPEQMQKQAHLTTRTDVYSLGVLAYLLLTGKPPFDTSEPERLRRKILEQEPTPPQVLNPQINSGFTYVLQYALAKEPDLRYPTAGEFANALAESQHWQRSDMPAPGGGTGYVPKTASPAAAAQPRRGLVGVMTLLLLVLLLGLGYIMWRPAVDEWVQQFNFGRFDLPTSISAVSGGSAMPTATLGTVEPTPVATPLATATPTAAPAVAVAAGNDAAPSVAADEPIATAEPTPSDA
ncbi:MAG: serine/threonine protein kinase, partial [Anaerolineae bacterium]|nr:serine/threonine protein kinase [Anaerolineae bacterium]